MAIRCIAQVVEAYKRDKSKRPKFRPHASVPYDQRIMSFKGMDRVSLLTLEGRVVVTLRRDVNHTISKQLVAKAKDTGKGIALEELKGIRARTRFRKQQRAKMSGWAFFQLRTFIEYKAQLAGMLRVIIDPRNTSRTCAECGHCEQANRPSQDSFLCILCGHEDHADINAARNIRARALVSGPKVSTYSASAAAAG